LRICCPGGTLTGPRWQNCISYWMINLNGIQ
jgi:hypothetical protein